MGISERKLQPSFGFGRTHQLLLRAGGSWAGDKRAKRCDHRQGNAGGIRGHGAQPHGAGNRDAFPIGEPAAERVGHKVIVAHARKVVESLIQECGWKDCDGGTRRGRNCGPRK